VSDYDKKDAAKDTGTTPKKVTRAWHDARDDAAGAGDLEERNRQKVSDSPEGREIYDRLKRVMPTPPPGKLDEIRAQLAARGFKKVEEGEVIIEDGVLKKKPKT